MSSIRFRTINDMLDVIPTSESELTAFLREEVLRVLPQIREKLSYNVPFFYRNKNICYLWPASVLWGKRKTYEGVRMGFTQGYLISGADQWLEQGNRKHVYWKTFRSIEEVDRIQLQWVLLEAWELDQRR